MKLIKASTNDVCFKVDDDDFDNLNAYKWYVRTTSCGMKYGFRVEHIVRDGKKTTSSIYIHRQIMNAVKGMDVDHLNHDTLDNQKSNLRVVTHGVNQTNRKVLTKAKSGYRGVYSCDSRGWWKGEYRMKYLGRRKGTDGARELARLYDLAALRDQGINAQLNFPIQQHNVGCPAEVGY